jgi:hypothetical protein
MVGNLVFIVSILAGFLLIVQGYFHIRRVTKSTRVGVTLIVIGLICLIVATQYIPRGAGSVIL